MLNYSDTKEMTFRKLMKNIVNGSWVIKRVHQGRCGQIRIDAETRFYNRELGADNFFSMWLSKTYVDRERAKYGYGPIQITNY